jgi:hypothetical protein
MTSKYFTALCSAGFMTAVAMTSPASADPLSGYRWKSRLLVIAAANPQSESAAIQRQTYQRAINGMTDRDVVLVEATGNSSRAKAIRTQLAVSDTDFKVLLVGKDGNTAASSEKPFAADEVFGRIDAMPMRRDEVGRKAR